MTIKLPDAPGFFQKIQTGKINCLRLPKGNMPETDIITAWTGKPDDKKITLKISNIRETRLDSITSEEAQAEGFTIPEFCARLPICKNIEFRLDLNGIALSQDPELPPKSLADIDAELSQRAAKGCSDCLIKKSPKDLFLDYWKKVYPNYDTDQPVSVISFELA